MAPVYMQRVPDRKTGAQEEGAWSKQCFSMTRKTVCKCDAGNGKGGTAGYILCSGRFA
ncbi:MAG: hypothetical protein IKD90_11405 [Clostridiales bacterium]|nr:hypothetical protein [Clostridiales bacterium]